jgi:peptidyl-prolyl cis-trans isomerase SurA|tara:strand:+ start:102 stop:1343 length:1242 start_codon:yes stop_codon:yes gene_type:complete
MKKILLPLIILTSIPLFAKIEVLDRVAVIVDDGIIMESQISNDLATIITKYDEQNIPKPAIKVLREQVVENLIIEELQMQMANRAGIRISDTELNETITRIAGNNNMGLQEFILFVQEGGDSYDDLRQDIKKEMIVQRIQRGRVGSEIDITEKEFQAFLATDDSLAELQPELLVRQILVKTLSQADKVILRIESGEDFGRIAEEVSLSGNAKDGGIMKWRKSVDMPELFSNALDKKKVNDMTDPLESGSGFHILRLEEKRGSFVQEEEQWSSRHILLIPSAMRDETSSEKQLNDIRLRVMNGEDFAELADEFSQDPGSAKKGGELGWLGKGVLADEFQKTMIESEINTVSEVFKTEFGFHFLEVLEKRNHDMTDKLIEDRAYQLLYARKYEEELESTLRSMRAEAFVEIKDLD